MPAVPLSRGDGDSNRTPLAIMADIGDSQVRDRVSASDGRESFSEQIAASPQQRQVQSSAETNACGWVAPHTMAEPRDAKVSNGSPARRQSEEDLFLRRRRSQRKYEGELKLHARRASAGSVVSPASASVAATKGFYGSFDDSRYWDYAFRLTNKGDMGHHCRECRKPFCELNKAIAVRRGGRIELRYHESCFSMHPDPRTQPASSANMGKFVDSLKGTEAPEELYRKMRTRGHW